jgi:hypothetical protein
MKRPFSYSLFLFVFLILLSQTATADVIPPNSHRLNRCVKFVNLDEFPDLVLIGRDGRPWNNKYKTFQIENNKCLKKAYKFNTLSIYWNNKDKPNSIEPDKLLFKNIRSYGGYIDNNNPLIKEDIEYSVAGFSDGKLVVYKSKHTLEYRDGTPSKVETFDNPLENQESKNKNNESKPTAKSSSKPEKSGPWHTITHFFKKLFG